jgi:hypothetical protein
VSGDSGIDERRREWLERVVAACARAAASLESGGRDHPHHGALLADIRALQTRLTAELAEAPPPA